MAGPRTEADKVGLPIRTVLYTIDQVATMLALEPRTVKASYLYLDGINVGSIPKRVMLARNIDPDFEPPSHSNPDGKGKPEWRIAEHELIRWLKEMGFRIYDRGWVAR